MARARFGHWLVRQVGYDALLFADRRGTHRLVAEAIESEAFGADPPSDDSLRDAAVRRDAPSRRLEPVGNELALHWDRAGASRRAGLCFLAAAWEAESMSRLASAVALAGEAERRLEGAGDMVGALGARLCRGIVHERMGRPLLALDDLAAARGEAPHGPTPESAMTAPAWISARALVALCAASRMLARYPEAVAHGREALARLADGGGSELRAIALNVLGSALYESGDLDAARGAYEESYAIRRDRGDKRAESASLNNLGITAWIQGHIPEAARMIRDALHRSLEAGDRFGAAAAQANLAGLFWRAGELETARRDLTEALQSRQAIGDRRGEGSSLANLGNVLFTLGDTEGALARLTEAIEVGRSVSDVRGVAVATWLAAQAHQHAGRIPDAESACREAIAICVKAGIRDFECDARSTLASMLLAQGRRDEARKEAEAALAFASGSNFPEHELRAELAMAAVESDPDRADRAVAKMRESKEIGRVAESLLVVAEAAIERNAGERAARALDEVEAIAERCGYANLHAAARRLRARGVPTGPAGSARPGPRR